MFALYSEHGIWSGAMGSQPVGSLEGVVDAAKTYVADHGYTVRSHRTVEITEGEYAGCLRLTVRVTEGEFRFIIHRKEVKAA